MHAIRYILGLTILVALLMVASVPALLEPTTRGVELAATKVGLLDEPKQPASSEEKEEAKPVGDPADPRLAVRGYVVEEDGDLRDTLEEGEREAMLARTRLRTGAERLPLPGQAPRDAAAVPPAQSEEGVLLDVTGCPTFRPGTDVAALLADDEVRERYASKVDEADDPDACAPVYDQRVADATAPVTARGSLERATARERASLRRGSASAMLIGLSELALMEQLLDDESLADALAALDAEAAPAASEAGAATRRAGGA